MAALFSLRYESVQTYVARRVARYLSTELHTRVEIHKVKVVLFKSLLLEGFLVEDRQKDILISSPKLTVDLNFFSWNQRKIAIETTQMDNGQFFIKTYKNKSTNLDFIINYFKSAGKKPEPGKKKKSWDITFNKIVLNNIRFRYRDYNAPDTMKGTMNFGALSFSKFNATILRLDTKNHLAGARIERLTFHEKSGFYLKNLTSDFSIDTNQIEFKNLLLETRTTRISNYLLLKYQNFGDFGKFVKNVYLKAELKNSILDAADLHYFVPGIKTADLKVEVDGKINGYTENIKARDFSVKIGQATYMKGNFAIQGLPDIDQTFLDLEFDQVFGNKKDTERIIKMATGKTVLLPEVIQKFGNIYFKGRFTGFPKDFIAFGEFKTSLGRFVSDVNMKIGKTQVYTGTLKAYDFNIGELLDNEKLGRVSFSTNIKGQGFDYDKLKEEMDTRITYLDFNNYRYTNVRLKGTLSRKLFKGQATVGDRNVNLDFNGGLDMNPKLPIFNFVATIRNANLHALNFTKDTLQVDADFNTNFSGSNLDNIQGELVLKEIRITNPEHSFTVDSVFLTANGIGNNRSLTIKSDILDAGIKGNYDLNTLPAYFVQTAKRYIPSLKYNGKVPKEQNFDLSIKLKYFEPLGALFAPSLQVPNGATLDGKFVSAENKVTVNGFAKLITYNNIRINDLILDQNNSDQALFITVISDRVDFSDSLYVKNVNMASLLRNDSLSLNVKLSDKDAANQLDMNGLIEFDDDSTATFSLLPSDVIINRESWKVTDKASIDYDKGKTTINGFQLFRDNQLLSINGIVSSDPEDHLILDFAKFKLASFNPLTKGMGVNLSGELNGKVSLSSLLKIPAVDANLIIDSLVFNKTQVGTLTFNALYDNGTRLVNSKTIILKDGKETLRAEGTFNARSEDNSLDMAVTMNNSELIILEPFIKNLASNLAGTLSTDLKLTGTLKAPVINGTLGMNNATMTVNYLKTRYHITDKVTVQNSVIKLNGLVIKDIRENQAIADGTVDMSNPSKPNIQLSMRANNFMALNTTAKDNPLYYGIAYGTGNFSFRGPVDNMRIDIKASTESGTIFNIPLNSAYEVMDNNLITFVAKDSAFTPKKQNYFGGLTMNFELSVGESTSVNIFTDQGRLYGRGTADLNLNISTAGDFQMTGNYLISEGKFNFTAQDYLNREFKISSGGSIKWTGNPTDAIINLRAIYSQRTSVEELYVSAGVKQKNTEKKVAEAVMNLSESLLKPKIEFDLNFPTDASIKDELQNYFSDPNNVYMQAMSLIVQKHFTGSSNFQLASQLKNTGVDALTQVLANQVNNFLTNAFKLNFVDLNIRSLNEASATLRFFKDRLIITGGVTDDNATSNFDVIGSGNNKATRDIEAQYLIKRDGSLTLSASNRPANTDFLTYLSTADQNYVNAIGLIYRQDFDNFKELLKILSGQRRREEKKKAKQAVSNE